MVQTEHVAVDHRSAWRGSDFGSVGDVCFDLTSEHLGALDDALRSAQAAGLTIDTVGRDDFDLSEIADDLAPLEHEILHGRGIVILRGFPVAEYTLEETELMYWGFGCYFGAGESQSNLGDRVGRVEDVSGKDHNERAYRNSVELMLHTDLTDIIAMLAIRKSAQGGLSTYVSAAAIHNEILATRPEYLDPLYRGFRYHRFGAESPGEAPVTPHRVPVLSQCEGHLSARIVPEYIYMAAEELGEPLTDLELASLDYFNEVAARPDMRFDVMLEPGDLSLMNNYTVLHTRDAFYDGPAEAQKRLLLRLWLSTDYRRPILDSLEIYASAGIEPVEGRQTYYDGPTDALSQLRPAP